MIEGHIAKLMKSSNSKGHMQSSFAITQPWREGFFYNLFLELKLS